MKFQVNRYSDGYSENGPNISEYIEIDSSDIADLCQLEYKCSKCVDGLIYTKVKRKTITTKCAACDGKGKFLSRLGEQLLNFLNEHLKVPNGPQNSDSAKKS